jgi:hypothetical protein
VIVSAQTNLLIGHDDRHDDVTETISRVKNVPASQIDPALPQCRWRNGLLFKSVTMLRSLGEFGFLMIPSTGHLWLKPTFQFRGALG